MKNLLQITLVACLAICCKSQQNSQESFFKDNYKDNLEKYNMVKENSQFSLSTGSCLGTCPVFDFYMVNDSLVLLTAKENTVDEGYYYYYLSESERTEISKLLSVDWAKFNKEYPTTMKDLPEMEFNVRMNSEGIRIRVMGTEPKALFDIKETLVIKVNDFEWTEL